MPTSVSRKTGAEILEAHAFFKMLGTDLLLKLADGAKFICESTGSILCRQGDQPDKCYIVMSGTVGVFIDKNRKNGAQALEGSVFGKKSKTLLGVEDTWKPFGASHGEQVTTLGPGRLFGELALINSEPRAATVKCLGDCEFLTIDKNQFNSVIKKVDFLKGIRFFQDFPPRVVAEVAKVAQFQTYLAKEFVFLQGDSPGSCYIVILGQADIFVDKDGGPLAQNKPDEDVWRRQLSAPDVFVVASKSRDGREGRRNSLMACFGNVGECVVTLGPGSLFGELALLNDKPRSASVKCQSDCTFLVLSRDEFEMVLKEDLKRLGDDKTTFLLSHLPGFATLSYPRPESTKKPPLAYFFKKMEFPRGHVFVRQGMHENKGGAAIFVILQGSADFFHAIDGKLEDAVRSKCTDMLRSQRPATFTRLPKLRAGSHLCGVPAIHHAGTLAVGGVYAVFPSKVQLEPFTLVASSSPCIVWQIDGADMEQLPKKFVAQVQQFVAAANVWRLSSYQSIYSRRVFEQFIGASKRGKPQREVLTFPVAKKPPGTGPSKAVAQRPLSRAASAPGSLRK
eukprot:TRINITY_DN23118_c0_g1_i1.p1 TRINITY_DN23118_c0_g1~~TRINITY_DN23118_c0_g1_i1.p1  ORF type:complete len:565 (-),score=80.92 TRINITY_DN23118_c0_g1_i1:81-1775(-)